MNGFQKGMFDPMKWLCDRLGRPHPGAYILDRVGEMLIGSLYRPAWAGAQMAPPANILMAINAGPEPPAQPLPQKAKGHHGYKSPKLLEDWFLGAPLAANVATANKSREVSDEACSNPRYRGMHGVPCSFMGGTDLTCPRNTVSGWFWKYHTGQGVYYYVDCCGAGPNLKTKLGVWCNWVDESNWCLGQDGSEGKGETDGVNGLASVTKEIRYNCTLSIPEQAFVAAKVNDPKIADYPFIQVMGVDV